MHKQQHQDFYDFSTNKNPMAIPPPPADANVLKTIDEIFEDVKENI